MEIKTKFIDSYGNDVDNINEASMLLLNFPMNDSNENDKTKHCWFSLHFDEMQPIMTYSLENDVPFAKKMHEPYYGNGLVTVDEIKDVVAELRKFCDSVDEMINNK